MTGFLVSIVTLLGLALRVNHLTSGTLWLDEGYVVIQSNTPLGDLIRYAAQDGNTFFSIWIFKAWAYLFGKSELSYESLSVFFGILAIPMMYVLARSIFDRKAGVISAYLLAISLFHVLYSQEMRIYTFAIFVSLVAGWGLMQFMLGSKLRHLGFFSVASVLLLNSHAYAIFIVAAFFLCLFIHFRKDKAQWARLFMAAFGVGVLFLPALYCMLYQYLVLYRFDWIPKPTWETVNLAFVRMNSNSEVLFYAFPALILLAFIMAYREKWGRRSLVILLWFVVPLVCTVILSLLGKSFFQYSYMVLILPPYLLLVGLGVSRIPTKILQIGVVIVITYLSYSPLQKYYEGRVAGGRDKELYLYVKDHYKSGDVILHSSRHSFVPSLFYHDYALEEYFIEGTRSWHGFEYYGYQKKTQMNVVELKSYERVWIVTYDVDYNVSLRGLLNDPQFLAMNPRLVYSGERNRLLLFELS